MQISASLIDCLKELTLFSVSLARAVYSRASILLLDDVLSAGMLSSYPLIIIYLSQSIVDAHTAHHLYHEKFYYCTLNPSIYKSKQKACQKTRGGGKTCSWSHWSRYLGNIYSGLWEHVVQVAFHSFLDHCFSESCRGKWLAEVRDYLLL